jgi:pectin methylesterase-like acyl-CoA thioesterase
MSIWYEKMKKIALALAYIFFHYASGTGQVYDIVVAKDGSGDFTTFNAAIESIPENSTRKIIFIKKGIYEEKVFIGNRWAEVNKVVSLIGENPDSVIITWSDYIGKSIAYPGKTGLITADGTTCPTLTVTSPDFYMENITVKNPSTQAQAVALYQTADRQTLKNCRILGNQDTYRLKKGRRFFVYRSTVEGGVDFIYAGGTTYFYQCIINSNRNGYITAPEDIVYSATLSSGRTLRYGFFFNDCDIIANPEVVPGSVYLGRPWGPECGSVFIKCRLGNHINPVGWAEWGGNETTACFAEFQSMNADGTDLIDTTQRVSWSFQISSDDLNKYMTLDKIFASVSQITYDPVSLIVAPAPVSGLNCDGQNLTWNPVNGAKGFVIYANGSAIGFSIDGSYSDTLSYSTTPVYNVRIVGPHGNLSLPDGQTDTVTEESINAVINPTVAGLIELNANIEKAPVVLMNGMIQFELPTNLSLYNISGQKIFTGNQVMNCDINSLANGIYILQGSDAINGFYTIRIRL